MKKNKCIFSNTREKIIQAAQNLFIKNSYSSVSMNDIAKKLSLSKPALYHHFKSKEKLYLEILTNAMEEYHKNVEKILVSNSPTKEKFQKMLDVYLNLNCDPKHQNLCSSLILMQKLSRNEENIINYVNKARKKSMKLIEPFIKEILNFNNQKNMDPKLMFLLVSGCLNAYIADHAFLKNNRWTNEQVINHITTLVFKN